MNTKGFLLLMITVIVIGGSIGGAFAGGLALGRSQSDDAIPQTAILQPQFGGGQPTAGGFTRGGLPGGQSSGVASNGEAIIGSDGEAQGGQHAPPGGFTGSSPEGGDHTGQDGSSRFGSGAFDGRSGFGGILSGTVGTVDGNVFTVTTESGETEVSLDDNSAIQVYETVNRGDLSEGDRVLVIASGDVDSGEPVSAASVVVNPPEGGGVFSGGGFGGRGGFAGGASSRVVLNGIVGSVDGNVFTVTTDAGETQVSLDDASTIQVHKTGTADDLSPGGQVLVIMSGDAESGEPAKAVLVIVNPPEGAGIFGGGGFGTGGFGGRPRGR